MFARIKGDEDIIMYDRQKILEAGNEGKILDLFLRCLRDILPN